MMDFIQSPLVFAQDALQILIGMVNNAQKGIMHASQDINGAQTLTDAVLLFLSATQMNNGME